MHSIAVESIGDKLKELLQAIASGEEVVIVRGGENIARVVPYETPQPRRVPGSAIGKITVSADFDEPLPDFAEYQ